LVLFVRRSPGAAFANQQNGKYHPDASDLTRFKMNAKVLFATVARAVMRETHVLKVNNG
jgi:hypothetical protein